MVGVTAKGNRAKAIRELKAQGNKAMANGAFQKAVRQYTKALELDPGNAVLYSNRSAAHFNMRQFAESLEDAESAILCDSMCWKAYKRKGLSLIHMQRYKEAIDALEEGLGIVKVNAEIEKNLEFARACLEQAQNLYILPEPHMMQRLESVPVFIVTDDVGQPFFVTYEDGQQVCTFYFDQADANATLDWIKSENPDLGDAARVIHITLNQAFNLAQETQKQYYEETTRAAVEEDKRAAEELEKARKAGKDTVPVVRDVDGSDEEKEEASASGSNDEESSDALAEGADSTEEPSDQRPDENVTTDAKASSDANDKSAIDESAIDEDTGKDEAAGTDAEGSKADVENKDGNKSTDNGDDAAIDENTPLSFQFRPELRQVQVAVELLNKHPNPPLKPILRDPPSVRKAKAEAAAAAAAEAEKAREAEEAEKSEDVEASSTPDSSNDVSDKGTSAKAETATSQASAEESPESTSGNTTKPTDGADLDDDEDVELTVDNFNGIPIFQAKGLTLLQNNEQLIPLFFSKWDLEAAWKQLTRSNTGDVPEKCEIDVGTLEDVLRRMSESKTKEFESVFFVPSRESMKAIGAKFPLDDLPSAKPPKPLVKKAAFSKAKQVAARGGSRDEIRAAIREDLELHAERQRMAELLAQIEQARRSGAGSAAAPQGPRRPVSGHVERTMRRNAKRLEKKQAAREAAKAASAAASGSTDSAGGKDKDTDAKQTPKSGETNNPERNNKSAERGLPAQAAAAVSSASVMPKEQAPETASC